MLTAIARVCRPTPRLTLLAGLLAAALPAAGQTTQSFQNGTGGYTGTVDNNIRQDTPDAAGGGETDITVDQVDPLPTQALVRFDSIVGNGVGQIPPGSTINSARAIFRTNSSTAGTIRLHRMLLTWSNASTWNSFGGNGVNTDGVEAATTATASLTNLPNNQFPSFDVTADVQAWVNGSAPNHGWLITNDSSDGWDFWSSEYTVNTSHRPRLEVTFTAPVGDPPEVSITAPVAGSAFDAPASIDLAATATDTEGPVSKVEFFANGTLVGTSTTEPFLATWSPVFSGAYTLTAVATDSDNRTTTSTAVAITVNNVDNVPPVVSLTAPEDGATIVTDTIAFAATASDTDGTVSRVEFHANGNKVAEDASAPFAATSAALTAGTYTLTAVAVDNDGGTTTSSPRQVSVVVPIALTAVERGATWKYLDNGSDQGTAWKESAFDDTAWAAGPAPLGFGDSHIVTTVNGGPSGARFITTYFRRTFNLPSAAAVQALDLEILRDDGAVVYINGVEVARQNMPAGPINYLTDTPDIISGSAETTYFPASVSPLPPLVDGTNVIAVEVHQRDNQSSDLGFDLELTALLLPGEPPSVTLTAPVSGATFQAPAGFVIEADASDTDGTVTKVEFFLNGVLLGEDNAAPFTFAVSNLPQGSYALTAVATDNLGVASPVSAPVTVTVTPPNTLPPTVALTSPAPGASFLAPASILLVADASDSDGSVVRVDFFEGANLVGTDSVAPFEFTWSGVPVGTYMLTAVATDNLTAQTTSAPVVVAVVPNLPASVSLLAPADSSAVGGPTAILEVQVDDPEGQPLTVSFWGRPKNPPPGPDFTIVTLPDTQFYSENRNNRFPQFLSQTNWIVSSRTALNTVFVAHMGDMTQSYDTIEAEFQRADQAMDIIEDPVTTLLAHGIPWGGAPGNHDIGSGGTTNFWNQYFGVSRFSGRPYWGGNYGTNNDNNYQFFSASGMDFIVINLKYRTSADPAVLNWADALLKAYPNHRAIVTSHYLIGIGNPAAWGGQGQQVYDALKDNPNLFLMLCGHIHGEGRRSDVFEGRTINTVLQDYQSRSDGEGGGGGWLRYFVFSPANNTISAYTYRTTTGTFETDDDSQFVLNYNMQGSAPWTPLGTVDLPAGADLASIAWTGLLVGEDYEWYATVTDGATEVASSAAGFTVQAAPALSIVATDNTAGEFGGDATLVFNIARTSGTGSALLVPVTSTGTASPGVDYSGMSSPVTIAAGEASTDVVLTALPDNEAEGPEFVTLTVSGGSNATGTIADKPSQQFLVDNIANPALRDPLLSPDGDPVPSLVEYFMGTLPDDASSHRLVEIENGVGATTFLVRYARAKNRPDVTGRLRWTLDVASGNWRGSGESANGVTVTIHETVLPPADADPETIEATVTLSSPVDRFFIRLEVN